MAWHDQLPDTRLNWLPLWRKCLNVCSIENADCATEQVEKTVTGYSRKSLADEEWCKRYGSWGHAGPWLVVVVLGRAVETSLDLCLPWIDDVAEDAGQDLFW